MPIFEAKILDADPDGNALLAMVLHPNPRARAAARKRGQARLQSGSMLEAMRLSPHPRKESLRVATVD